MSTGRLPLASSYLLPVLAAAEEHETTAAAAAEEEAVMGEIVGVG